MSPAESPDEVRQELAAEREQLGSAVQELRTEVDALRRKLPYVAAAALAAGLLIKLARRRSSR
jgi:outer membrane murein-binding lipoprotein Lpp